MKFTNKLVILGAMVALTSVATVADEAEVLFDAKCSMCHSKTRPTDMSKVVAPALMGVMRHVKMTYPNKDEAVKFMVDYILEPSKDKAICMPNKIERFGLMPSQKGNVSKDELQKITSWMYNNFPPANFRGMGRGMGHGNMQGM
jgi:cytochrome c